MSVFISNLAGVSKNEEAELVAQEVAEFKKLGKELLNITIYVDKEGFLSVKSVEKSPIRRVRRITGYLAPIENFNESKLGELADRQVHPLREL